LQQPGLHYVLFTFFRDPCQGPGAERQWSARSLKLWPLLLPFAKSHSGAAAVLVDEFDAGQF
jgi:hypothetical protein